MIRAESKPTQTLITQTCTSYEVLITNIIIHLFFCCVKLFKIKYYKNNLLLAKHKNRSFMISMISRVTVAVYRLRDIPVLKTDALSVQAMIMAVPVMTTSNSHTVSDICTSCKKIIIYIIDFVIS